jgi:hypothetical protein
MRHANLKAAKLYGVRLSGADLRDNDFRGSDFGGVITDSTRKPFTDFSFADLRGADLSDLNLQQHNNPDPYGQYLHNISTAGAWFIGADLRGAKLGRKALGITDKNDHQALNFALDNLKLYGQWDEKTEFPAEITQALTQWNHDSENAQQQNSRWQRLFAVYTLNFGDERSARLQSYLHLFKKAQHNEDSTNISDLVCRKELT